MNILSSSESDLNNADAQSLSAYVCAHYERLKAGEFAGTRGRLPHFRLVQRDRNTIYRIRARNTWYLKIPSNNGGDVVERETLGAATLAHTTHDSQVLIRDHLVLGNLDPPFLFSSAISGRNLNLLLYRACVMRSSAAFDELLMASKNLGTAVALLHDASCDGVRPTNRQVSVGTIGTARAVKPGASSSIRDVGFVHGNLRLDNVLTSKGLNAVIDFENCGVGSIYADLSLVCCAFLLTRVIAIFPSRSAMHAMTSMLTSYAGVRAFDPSVLALHIRDRLEHFKAEASRRPRFQTRVAGIPISAGRLDRLIAEIVSGDPILGGWSR